MVNRQDDEGVVIEQEEESLEDDEGVVNRQDEEGVVIEQTVENGKEPGDSENEVDGESLVTETGVSTNREEFDNDVHVAGNDTNEESDEEGMGVVSEVNNTDKTERLTVNGDKEN